MYPCCCREDGKDVFGTSSTEYFSLLSFLVEKLLSKNVNADDNEEGEGRSGSNVTDTLASRVASGLMKIEFPRSPENEEKVAISVFSGESFCGGLKLLSAILKTCPRFRFSPNGRELFAFVLDSLFYLSFLTTRDGQSLTISDIRYGQLDFEMF